MPRILTTAEFQGGQALASARAHIGQIKALYAGLATTIASASVPPASTSPANSPAVKQVAAQTTEVKRLAAELKNAQSVLSEIGLEKMKPQQVQQVRVEFERTRQEALALRDATVNNVVLQGQYADLVTRSTRALNDLNAGARGLSGTPLGQGFLLQVRELDASLTRLETNRKVGKGNIAAYRAELDAVRSTALKASQAAATPAEGAAFGKTAQRAQNLISAADTREAERLSNGVVRLKALLLEQKITSEQAATALNKLADRASALMTVQSPASDVAARYARVLTQARTQASELGKVRVDLSGARDLDAVLTRLETNRKVGKSNLAAYRAELEQIRAKALSTSQAAPNNLEGAAFGKVSQRAQSLISAADTREVQRLAGAVVALKALLADQKITADQAGLAFTKLAERASTLMNAQGIATDVALGYARVLTQARNAANSVGGGEDAALNAARAMRAELADLNAQRRLGIKTTNEYRAAVIGVRDAALQDAQAHGISTKAMREYRAAAAAAADELKRLRAQGVQGSSGGSLPFALNSVGFMGGGFALGGQQILAEGLKLNEQLKQSQLTLESTAKFYKVSVEDAKKQVIKTAADLRQSESTVGQAMANLLRKSFTPEMAAIATKRISDAANAAGLNATSAIKGGTEAILSEQSRQLNSAGIAENLGPELTKMNAALAAGKEYIGPNNPYRKFYDELRAQGKTVNEATKAVTLYQFLLKATDPVAGRTAASLNTLTGALNNFQVQREKSLASASEGLALLAIPALNEASNILKKFNSLPAVVKNTLTLSVAFGALGLATISAGSLLLSFALQTRKASLEMLNLIMVNRTASVVYKTLTADVVLFSRAGTVMNTTLAASNFAFARSGAAALAWGSAVRVSGVAALGVLGILAAVTTAIAAVGYGYGQQTLKIYDDIDQSTKDFWTKMGERNGKEYVEALKKQMILIEARGPLTQKLEDADTPEERQNAQQALNNINARILAQRSLLTTLSAKNRAEKGDATATQEQAEAYRNLLLSIRAVQERFGDTKLSTFQKDLRAAAQEQERLLRDIKKGEAEYEKSERTAGLSPEQAKDLRKKAADLVPQSITSLVEREQATYRNSAVAAQISLERGRIEAMKDGAAKRQALLKVETRELTESYRQQIQAVRQNRDDPNLNPEQRRVFADEEARLIQERQARIKLLQDAADREIVEARKARTQALLDLTRRELEAELGIVQAGLTALNTARDVSLARISDPTARLAVEQQFAAKSLALVRQQTALEGRLRRAQIQQDYQKALADAQTFGTRRAEAEGQARRVRDLQLEAESQDRQNSLDTARLEQEERVQQARAAIVERWVKKQLEGLDTVEGATLASLRRTLTGYLAYYRSRGETESADQVQQGLDQLDGEARSRAQTLEKAYKSSAEQLEVFGDKLDELTGKASKGLTGIRTTAQKPFSDLTRQISKEITDLEEARSRLVGTNPTIERNIDIRIAELTAKRTEVEAAGRRAALQAVNRAVQAERDKAVEAQAKRTTELYGNGEGDYRVYLAGLNTEQTYWTARLKGMETGSDEYVKAQARIEELTRTRQEVRQQFTGQRPTTTGFSRTAVMQDVEQARSSLALNEANSKLARTDAERVSLTAQRLRLLQRIADLEGRNADNPLLSQADRQGAQLAALEALAQIKEAEDALRRLPREQASQALSLLDAQSKLVRTDAQRLDLLARRIPLLQTIQALEQAASMDPANSQAEQGQAAINALGRAAEVQEALRALRAVPAEQTRAALTLLDAESKLARTEAERLRLTLRRLTLLNQLRGQEQAVADDASASEEERRTAAQSVLTLQADLIQEQRNLADAQRSGVTALRELAGAQVDYALALARSSADVQEARMARALLTEQAIRDLDTQIALARERGQSEQDVTALLTERQRRVTDLLTQARDLAAEALTLDRARLDLVEAQGRALEAEHQISQTGLASLARQLGLIQARQALEERSRAATGAAALSEQDRQASLKASLDLRGQEVELLEKMRLETVRLTEVQQAQQQRLGKVSAQDDRLMNLKVERDQLLFEERQLAAERRRLDQNRKRASQDGPATLATFDLESGERRNELLVRQAELTQALTQNTRAQEDEWLNVLRVMGDTNAAFDLLRLNLSGQGPLADFQRSLLALKTSRDALSLAESQATLALKRFADRPDAQAAEQLKTAFEALSSAVEANRQAIRQQAEVYRQSAQTLRGIVNPALTLDQRVNPKSTLTLEILAARQKTALEEARRVARSPLEDPKATSRALERLNETDSALKSELERLGRGKEYDPSGVQGVLNTLRPFLPQLDRVATRDELIADRLDRAADAANTGIQSAVLSGSAAIVSQLQTMQGLTPKVDPSPALVPVVPAAPPVVVVPVPTGEGSGGEALYRAAEAMMAEALRAEERQRLLIAQNARLLEQEQAVRAETMRRAAIDAERAAVEQDIRQTRQREEAALQQQREKQEASRRVVLTAAKEAGLSFAIDFTVPPPVQDMWFSLLQARNRLYEALGEGAKGKTINNRYELHVNHYGATPPNAEDLFRELKRVAEREKAWNTQECEC